MENSKENRKAISINIKMEGRCLSLCCAQQRERVTWITKQSKESRRSFSEAPDPDAQAQFQAPAKMADYI